MKHGLSLYYGKTKRFLTERRFPISINLNFGIFPDKSRRDLAIQIIELQHNNVTLKKEIKKLKTIVELRDMEFSLNKIGDC